VISDHSVECGRLVDTISPALLWVTQDIQTEKKTMREEDEKKKFKEANDGWDSDYQEEEKEEDDDDEEEEEGEEEKKKKKEEKKKIRALGHDCTHFMFDAAMQKTSVCTHYLCEAERRKSKAKEAKEKEEEDAAKNELRASKFKGIRRKLYGDSPKAGADSGEECSPLRSTASSEKGADSVFEDGEDEVFLMAAGSPTSKVLPQEG
jgi:hypothetical protein